jgi:CubicO group peptidase (beta-lactamase class C family)
MTLDDAGVHKLLAFADEQVQQGRLPSGQLALALGGEVVVRHTTGAAAGARYVTFSVTKAITAATAWLFPELTPDTLVVDLVPEFTGDGKERVTLEHLLTHTAGFPRAPMPSRTGADRAARIAKMATWRLSWEPGTQMEYHPISAHWVVATMVEAVAGAPFPQVVKDRLIDPLGLTSLSLGPDDRPFEPVVAVGVRGTAEVPEVATDDALLRMGDREEQDAGVPGGGAISSADDIALLYQHLLHDPKGLWDPAVLADGTGHVRNRLVDPWTGVPALRTLGLSIAGDDGKGPLRQFGKATGPRAFGASGVGGQMAWADPDSGLSFCYLTGGLDQDQVAAFVRANRLSTLAARCVPGAP